MSVKNSPIQSFFLLLLIPFYSTLFLLYISASEKHITALAMEPGDVLLVDNYRALHGRDVFQGDRFHAVTWFTWDTNDEWRGTERRFSRSTSAACCDETTMVSSRTGLFCSSYSIVTCVLPSGRR